MGSSIAASVAFGAILNGMFMVACAGLYMTNKTTMAGVAAIVGLISNVVANIILIPKFGLNGAAMSTVIAYFIQMLIGHNFSKKIISLKIQFIFIMGIGAILILINFLTEKPS